LAQAKREYSLYKTLFIIPISTRMFSHRRIGVLFFQQRKVTGTLQRVTALKGRKSFFLAQRAFSTDELDNRRKKLIYRAGVLGWLELDVLVGNFAARHVPTMTEAQCDSFNHILTKESPDLFKYLSGQKPLPEELQDNEVMRMMVEYVAKDKSAPYQDKFADIYNAKVAQ